MNSDQCCITIDPFKIAESLLIAIGGLAQLVERLLCKQEVSGSTPLSSTKLKNIKRGGVA
jgi:hypothetical protein